MQCVVNANRIGREWNNAVVRSRHLQDIEVCRAMSPPMLDDLHSDSLYEKTAVKTVVVDY